MTSANTLPLEETPWGLAPKERYVLRWIDPAYLDAPQGTHISNYLREDIIEWKSTALRQAKKLLKDGLALGEEIEVARQIKRGPHAEDGDVVHYTEEMVIIEIMLRGAEKPQTFYWRDDSYHSRHEEWKIKFNTGTTREVAKWR